MIGALLGFLVIWFRIFASPARHGGRHAPYADHHSDAIHHLPYRRGISSIRILAVVAAGVTHAVERDRMRSASIKLRVVSDSTWSVILFTLNGLVFILLGHEIPESVIKYGVTLPITMDKFSAIFFL